VEIWVDKRAARAEVKRERPKRRQETYIMRGKNERRRYWRR
jgi:hypothetical protein